VPCATSRRNHVKSHVFACEAMQHLHAPVQQREQCQDQERTCRHVHEVLCMHTHARTLESDEEIMNCSNIVPPFPEPKMAPGSAVLCLVVAVWTAPAAAAADPPALANQFTWVGDLYNVQEVSSTQHADLCVVCDAISSCELNVDHTHTTQRFNTRASLTHHHHHGTSQPSSPVPTS
jgi:hypothetical protein